MVATDNKTNEIIQTELGLLPKLISLPRQPESVKWQVNEDAGYLIALLNYAPHDYAYILKQSTVYLAENNESVDAVFFETWIPEKLRKSIVVKEKNNLLELQGVFPLQANMFTETELSPFVNGSIVPLGEGYILVSLFSM